MTIPTWPVTLPELPSRNYSEDNGKLILRSPMDKGPAKQRLQGKRPANLNLTFEMTTAQVGYFETFVLDTLEGVKRFTLKHPRKLTQVECRIIPQGDGKLYDIGYGNYDYWPVSFQVEILP